jgi:hypothetical protein
VGNPGIRLGHPLQGDLVVFLGQACQVYPLGQLPDQVIEHVHDLCAVLLKLLNDLHAGDQCLLALFELVDLRDPFVQLGDLR